MNTSVVYATSDCTIEDAVRVVSQYSIGSWAAVQHENSKETFVIKTSADETVVHKNIKFGIRHTLLAYALNNRVYTWDEFWKLMIEIYNLNPEKLIIVEEDELY